MNKLFQVITIPWSSFSTDLILRSSPKTDTTEIKSNKIRFGNKNQCNLERKVKTITYVLYENFPV